jgi:hypothetical protein
MMAMSSSPSGSSGSSLPGRLGLENANKSNSGAGEEHLEVPVGGLLGRGKGERMGVVGFGGDKGVAASPEIEVEC